MPARRELHRSIDVAPAQRREQITAILASGLARLIGVAPQQRAQPTASTGVAGEILSECAETGLELSRETRLSVPAG